MTLNKPACRRGRPKFNQNSGFTGLILAVLLSIMLSLAMPVEAKAAALDNAKMAYVPFLGPIISLKDALFSSEAKADEENELPVSGPRSADKKVQVVFTAYTSTVDQCDDDPFIAASGKRVYDGMIAANWLPFGTKIKIPALYGDKIFTVDDRMNKRYGYGRMDIWLDATKAEARKFGVQRTEIEIFYAE